MPHKFRNYAELGGGGKEKAGKEVALSDEAEKSKTSTNNITCIDTSSSLRLQLYWYWFWCNQ